MKYKPLPVEQELEQVRADHGDKAMEDARSELVASLLRHPGFQVVLILLRDIEADALRRIRAGRTDPALTARVSTVDFIRRTIEGIVPQTSIDWADEELEEFMPPEVIDF